MKNLAVGHAQKQREKQVPLLEDYQFIPYNESSTLRKNETQLLQQYIHACSSVAKKILESCGKNKDEIFDTLNGYTEVNDALIDKYRKSDSESYFLLKCLSSITNKPCSKELLQEVKSCASTYLNHCDNDILFQTLTSEYPLRAVTDVAFENITSRKHSVVEITGGNRSISSKINQYIAIPSISNMSYSIQHQKTEFSNKEHLPKNTEIAFWDNKSSLDYKDVDLFVFNYVNYSVKDLTVVLENASNCLNKDGFVLLLQRTRLTPAEKLFSTLGETILPTISESDLEDIYRKLNLNVICKKSDSIASSLYLLRKSPASSFKDLVVNVTANKYDSWVVELKEKMKQTQQSENSSNPERIWLVSEACNDSGIMGLANCLRQEPGGTNVRQVL